MNVAVLARPFRTAWAAVRRLPLRVQVVAGLVLLLAAVLIGSWLVASTTMQRYLLNQVDNRLIRTATTARHLLTEPGVDQIFRLSGRLPRVGADNEIQVRFQGRTLLVTPPQTASQPDLPDDPPLDHAFTVRSAGGDDGEWRVLATLVTVKLPTLDGPVQAKQPALVIVSANQSEVDAAVGDLSRLYLLISVGALVLVGGLGYGLVRGSLRPLEELESTAEAIATGDLSRRVPVRQAGTEVGRLATAFNTMVDRIEHAFRAREWSEASARGSEERMRRFVADASHELRTPLTSIRGYAELYRQGAVASPDDVAGVMRKIEDQAARMGLLVDDLLLLARLDQQRPLERIPVDLSVLAVDAVSDAHAVAPERSVGLRLPPAVGDEPAEVPVLGDEARLRQVLGNLVNNALAHTPPGTPIEVRVRADGPDAVLEVADTGPGLPPEAAERVFERFYRADPARGRDSGGTGLGLAIVAAIVAAHDGRVEMRTAVGEGSTFVVRLPLTAHPS